ncbi:MAG: hypothetical protein IKS98_13280 [Lachnospiraceae bacterium]|nr:hypothetical protein [Lachnospiraceae bacterium]
MTSLLEIIVAALTVVCASAPEMRLVTNVTEIKNYLAYGLCPAAGWIRLLIHIKTGELLMLVDYGRYKCEAWKLMLVGGYMPIPHSDALDLCPLSGGMVDVVLFGSKYFPVWLEGKRHLVRQILVRTEAFDGADVYMPIARLEQGAYVALGISESVRNRFIKLPKHYKHYLHGLPDANGVVIAPPSLEMVVGLGFELNPADWLIPEATEPWVDRPEHHIINGVPFELCDRYYKAVHTINSIRMSCPDKYVLSGVRNAERMIIDLEISLLKGTDVGELDVSLSRILTFLSEL